MKKVIIVLIGFLICRIYVYVYVVLPQNTVDWVIFFSVCVLLCVCAIFVAYLDVFSQPHHHHRKQSNFKSQDTELETEYTILDYLRESICYQLFAPMGSLSKFIAFSGETSTWCDLENTLKKIHSLVVPSLGKTNKWRYMCIMWQFIFAYDYYPDRNFLVIVCGNPSVILITSLWTLCSIECPGALGWCTWPHNKNSYNIKGNCLLSTDF